MTESFVQMKASRVAQLVNLGLARVSTSTVHSITSPPAHAGPRLEALRHMADLVGPEALIYVSSSDAALLPLLPNK